MSLLDKVNLSDDFMFARVMSDTAVCKAVLEAILGVAIEKVVQLEEQKSIDMLAESRGIRLDVYVKDEKRTVYNVEMQCETNKNLPKRSRYYQGMIDMDLIDKSDDYNKLTQSFVIFVCTFDLFKKGRHRYTFENRCLEDPTLGLEDKTTKIFLNTQGKMDDVSNELLEFFGYVEDSSQEQADHADSGLVKLLHERVNKVRASAEMEVEIMKLWMIEKERFQEGREEGRKEGLREGSQKVKLEIARTSIRTGLSKETIAQITGLSIEEIEALMET